MLATEIFTVSWLALLRVTELTVIPLPENATVTPLAKFEPLMTMFWLDVPCAREPGLIVPIAGPA